MIALDVRCEVAHERGAAGRVPVCCPFDLRVPDVAPDVSVTEVALDRSRGYALAE
jgi:hypothetical protein